MFFSCQVVARSFKSFEIVLLLRGRLVSKMVPTRCFILVLWLKIQNPEFVYLFVCWLVCLSDKSYCALNEDSDKSYCALNEDSEPKVSSFLLFIRLFVRLTNFFCVL